MFRFYYTKNTRTDVFNNYTQRVKIDKIFNELKETPFSGEGQPEQPNYVLTGLWSRRINKEHRIVYSVDENSVTVYVISAMGHYNGK